MPWKLAQLNEHQGSHDAGTRGCVGEKPHEMHVGITRSGHSARTRGLCLSCPASSRASPQDGLCLPPAHCLGVPLLLGWHRGGCGQDPAGSQPPGTGDPFLIMQAHGDTSFISHLSGADPSPGAGVASCPGREAELSRLRGHGLQERGTVTEGLPVHFPGGFLTVTSQKTKQKEGKQSANPLNCSFPPSGSI